MTLIHLDAVGGIAGDMFVAAMLDACENLTDRVVGDAAAVLPAGVGKPFLERGSSSGIAALRFGLQAGEAASRPSGTYRDMKAAIDAADLQPGTKDHAQAILTILAEAEAEIHQLPLDQVHFHEIADWDSLLDIVSAGSIAAALPDARWTVSALPRGNGLVKTAHGMLPVPAPATALILRDFLWRDDGVAGERVTPTGAAILKHLVDGDQAFPTARLTATGTGAGTRELAGMPNILRALIFEAPRHAGLDSIDTDRITVIEFEVDDMTGEEIGLAADRLRAVDGVLDVSIGHRIGKKGRPMQSFRLLARPADREAVVSRCFSETATIGLRMRDEERLVLPRKLKTVAGAGVKMATRPGGETTAKAESDALADGASLKARRALKRRMEDDDG